MAMRSADLATEDCPSPWPGKTRTTTADDWSICRHPYDRTVSDDTPALAAVRAAGLPHEIVRTARASGPQEAATFQGIALGALLRTIVVRRGEDDYLFVLVPADRRFDWGKLRAHLGVRRVTLPDAEEARAATGYERYTITPFGSRRQWPVIVDASAVGFERVSIGGGAFGVNLHLAPADLVRHFDAAVVDVSALGDTG